MLSPRLHEVLACPHCHAALRQMEQGLQCASCAFAFRIESNVPIMRDGPVEIVREHSSNAIGAEFEALLENGRDFILNIGAGGTRERYPHCIELEHKIFRHTDVVADAHHLPFRDASFDRVFAFNVFEHLRDPKRAAAEILRVLKPGGTTTIHTAFLQALHEAPHHYFNATEYGVREWFSAFEIENCDVSGNFGPGIMLAYLSANILQAAAEAQLPNEEQTAIGQTTLRDWSDFWNRRCTGPLPNGFMALQNMPQPLQKRVAGGFQLTARKPAR